MGYRNAAIDMKELFPSPDPHAYSYSLTVKETDGESVEFAVHRVFLFDKNGVSPKYILKINIA